MSEPRPWPTSSACSHAHLQAKEGGRDTLKKNDPKGTARGKAWILINSGRAFLLAVEEKVKVRVPGSQTGFQLPS